MEGEVYDQHGRRIGPQGPKRPASGRAWVASSARAGVGMGSALAIAISWDTNHSIIWAIIHGFFSWLYVLWFALTR